MNDRLSPKTTPRGTVRLLLPLLLLCHSGCFSYDKADGDNSVGDTTTTSASGQANQNNTTTTAGGDASVIAVPDNRRDVVENPGAAGLGAGACFIELSKPESESGPWAVLFSAGCPQFAEVCGYRLGEEEDETDPEDPETPADELFEPFEEECARKASTDAEGITKWAFALPGDFYTGDIVAEITAGQVITFTVKPGVRQEDIEPNDPSINDDDRLENSEE